MLDKDDEGDVYLASNNFLMIGDEGTPNCEFCKLFSLDLKLIFDEDPSKELK
jgi:hypothetical protein